MKYIEGWNRAAPCQLLYHDQSTTRDNKQDKGLTGTRNINGERIMSLAYADDVTIIIKKTPKWTESHKYNFKDVWCPNLTIRKRRSICFGKADNQPQLNKQIKETIRTIGQLHWKLGSKGKGNKRGITQMGKQII